MTISPIQPISSAWRRMVRILFRPFDLKKWLLLGFCAFLAQCGEGGGGGGASFPMPGGGGGGASPAGTNHWMEQNLGLIIALAIIGFVLLITILLLVAWVSSRGKFMFIDGVVKNRGAVREPWKEYRREGNSLFLFRIVLAIAGLLCLVGVVGIPLLIAIPDFRSETFGAAGLISIITGVLLVLSLIILFCVVSFVLEIFVIPTMYHRRVRALEGWRIAWRELILGHVGSAILLFLMMFLLGMCAVTLSLIAVFITCCTVIIPYVGTVILLPIPVFFLCYVLEYIQQFGDDWQILPEDCNYCGYLRTGVSSEICPECGKGHSTT